MSLHVLMCQERSRGGKCILMSVSLFLCSSRTRFLCDRNYWEKHPAHREKVFKFQFQYSILLPVFNIEYVRPESFNELYIKPIYRWINSTVYFNMLMFNEISTFSSTIGLYNRTSCLCHCTYRPLVSHFLLNNLICDYLKLHFLFNISLLMTTYLLR